MNFMEKIKDDNFRGITYFVLAGIVVFLFKASQNNVENNSRGFLITSFVFLFVMLLIFLWTNKKNKLLMLGAVALYAFFAWYWL